MAFYEKEQSRPIWRAGRDGMSVDWNIEISIESRSSDYGKAKEIAFIFKNGDQIWNRRLDSKQLHDENSRDAILREVARSACDEIITPKLVHMMLNTLVTSALKGENPLE